MLDGESYDGDCPRMSRTIGLDALMRGDAGDEAGEDGDGGRWEPADPNPGPDELAELAEEQELRRARLAGRDAKAVARGEDVPDRPPPTPTLLRGLRVAWPVPIRPGEPCAGCGDRPLGPAEYCLACDRWGLDHIYEQTHEADAARARIAGRIDRARARRRARKTG